MKIEPLDNDDNPCRPRHFKPTLTPESADDAPQNQHLERGRARLAIAGGIFAAAFALIGLRVAEITLLKSADSKLNHIAEVKPQTYSRADIIDRNGVVLASTLESKSLFANPKKIPDAALAAHQLAGILPDADEAQLLTKLTADKSFIWLHRHLTPAQQFAVNSLGIPGLDFQHEEKRIYPSGALGAHVVGYTDTDNKGLAGIERSFDAALDAQPQPLQLSIDIRLQAILKEEMQRTVDDFTAIGATGIIMDVKSGELLSMVSLPDFNPNDLNTVVPATIFNRATLGVYEMGSVFKIYNTALALENRKANLSTLFDCTHPIQIGRFTIHDYHPFNRMASVSEIFMESSNIGSARMAMESGAEVQKEFLGRLGLLHAASIEIPEVGTPMFPNPWHEVNTMTVAYGHGISVSPIQMAIATAAIVNGGILRPATLIKHADGYQPAGTRVISAHTSEQMRQLMRLVVTDGTGKNANTPGYLVGGKTGTAEKVGAHGGYAKKALLSSFIGAFPMNDPQYLVFVIIDEPHPNKKSYGFATAGWTAAPAVGRIIARMAPLFGIKPIDETPEIHRAISVDLPGLSKKIAVN